MSIILALLAINAAASSPVISDAEEIIPLFTLVGSFQADCRGWYRDLDREVIYAFTVQYRLQCNLPGTHCNLTLIAQLNAEEQVRLKVHRFIPSEEARSGWLILPANQFVVTESSSDFLRDVFALHDWDVLFHYDPDSDSQEIHFSRERMETLSISAARLRRVLPVGRQNMNMTKGMKLIVEVVQKKNKKNHLRLFYGSDLTNHESFYVNTEVHDIFPVTEVGIFKITTIENMPERLPGIYGHFYAGKSCTMYLAQYQVKVRTDSLHSNESGKSGFISGYHTRTPLSRKAASISSEAATVQEFVDSLKKENSSDVSLSVYRGYYFSLMCEGKYIVAGHGPLEMPKSLDENHIAMLNHNFRFAEGIEVNGIRYIAAAYVTNRRMSAVIGGLRARGKRCDVSLTGEVKIARTGFITFHDTPNFKESSELFVCGPPVGDRVIFEFAFIPEIGSLLFKPSVKSIDGEIVSNMPLIVLPNQRRTGPVEFDIAFSDLDGNRTIKTDGGQVALPDI